MPCSWSVSYTHLDVYKRQRQRKPRVGRNPKTGDRVEVPAKKIPFFKPSKELKDLVNNSPTAAVPPAPPMPPAAPNTH